jgi:tetratricopeptide (TPR) repeat protein
MLVMRARSEQGYRDYYTERPQDSEIRDAIGSNRNVIVVGTMLSGKTRAVFEALRRLPRCRVAVVKEADFADFAIPINAKRLWTREVVVLDDIDRLAAQAGFVAMLEALVRRRALLIATCRSGDAHERRFGELVRNWESAFSDRVVLGPIQETEARIVLDEAGLSDRDFDRFYGPIGSLFVPLKALRGELRRCSLEEKAVLGSLRALHISGAASLKEGVSEDRVEQVVVRLRDIDVSVAPQLRRVLAALQEKGFLSRRHGLVQCEEALLERVVESDDDLAATIFRLVPAFNDAPDVLARMGNTALDKAQIDRSRRSLSLAAIKCYDEALTGYTASRFPIQFGSIQVKRGNAFRALAEVWDKARNCKDAIEAYKEALKVYGPVTVAVATDYAMAQFNLGNAYRTLAEVEEKASNCKRALAAYSEASAVYTRDAYPEEYSRMQSAIGNAYRTLAEAEDALENCRSAIISHTDALTIRTRGSFPQEYGMSQHNLGNAYLTLARILDRAGNCRRAIGAYKEALEVRPRDVFPMQRGATQHNLGSAYASLAEVNDAADNCRHAIDALKDALTARARDEFPMQYGATQNNLGNAYRRLAEVEHTAMNCRLAIAAFQEALMVRPRGPFPMDYGMTQNNLGNAFLTLAEVGDRTENCRLAITAYKEAIAVRPRDGFPMDYGATLNNLGSAYVTLAGAEEKGTNCRKGIAALQEALTVRTRDAFPMQYGATMNNLGVAYVTLADVEEKVHHCNEAIVAFREALTVRERDAFPMQHGATQNNLGVAYAKLAGVAGVGGSWGSAVAAFSLAEGIFSAHGLVNWESDVSINLDALKGSSRDTIPQVRSTADELEH